MKAVNDLVHNIQCKHTEEKIMNPLDYVHWVCDRAKTGLQRQSKSVHPYHRPMHERQRKKGRGLEITSRG